LTTIPRPSKLICLAGNYAEHVIERGGTVAERHETFPYLFLKPANCLIDDGEAIVLPKNAPQGVDWELELGVVIGKRCKNVLEANALEYVAGYTIINDVTQRQFRPTPGRKKRERDVFFDWQHGKWFDRFCPIGPRIVPASEIEDPQNLQMKLTVNGVVKQQGSTGQMIFPVAALIEFISSICTLEPGDIIATGTPKGVGSASGTFLQAGDVVEATIEKIGTLRNPVVLEV
jgi:2-keto-4-pentenoate hydratase/2-oxohepta-3-ene-1,7-dioic acid hydratase in catechol pathway